MNKIAFAAMREELAFIVKEANAARNMMLGASAGGAAAVLTGNGDHAGKAMIGGALAPTLIRHPKKILTAGAVGLPLYYGLKATNTQADHHQRVGNAYTREMLTAPPSDAGPWL